MNSETSDTQVKVHLDIDRRPPNPDAQKAVSLEFRYVGGVLEASIQGSGFDESDAGARDLVDLVDMAMEAVQRSIPEAKEESEDESIVRRLIEGGMEEDVARTVGLQAVQRFRLSEPDPERWASFKDAGINTQADLDAQRQAHGVQGFETPQHVRDARAARRAERKGFNPKPKGGK